MQFNTSSFIHEDGKGHMCLDVKPSERIEQEKEEKLLEESNENDHGDWNECCQTKDQFSRKDLITLLETLPPNQAFLCLKHKKKVAYANKE
ncbi:hypothetical protein RO3G_14052 [Rhizopus delemar RA 99-880]|uniref:Uncharacterized protein n=1 Tax=Rhizopus delemar (strain RA 99-880 / ATCC MYA-4621 / FGSC 9543 / NRRL 43880) TaxID=246409 RepID=I1CLL1_RHIO9|nr:hypothetical protein RO3G_14052 [Rhizopus delemar RA 99-880]|eukprot:EIE89341.1 hypothetical protein RO3G_14052 [Rhizopus delemar RA 99-880]